MIRIQPVTTLTPQQYFYLNPIAKMEDFFPFIANRIMSLQREIKRKKGQHELLKVFETHMCVLCCVQEQHPKMDG